MIGRARRIAAFWYDFVVGDDWRVAVGVVVALAVTYGLSEWTSLSTWWVIPLAVVALLPWSLHRAVGPPARRRRSD